MACLRSQPFWPRSSSQHLDPLYWLRVECILFHMFHTLAILLTSPQLSSQQQILLCFYEFGYGRKYSNQCGSTFKNWIKMASRLAVQTLFSMKIQKKLVSCWPTLYGLWEVHLCQKNWCWTSHSWVISKKRKKRRKFAFFHWFFEFENCQYLGIGNR